MLALVPIGIPRAGVSRRLWASMGEERVGAGALRSGSVRSRQTQICDTFVTPRRLRILSD
jgi:hypothetical protein